MVIRQLEVVVEKVTLTNVSATQNESAQRIVGVIVGGMASKVAFYLLCIIGVNTEYRTPDIDNVERRQSGTHLTNQDKRGRIGRSISFELCATG